MASGNPFLPAVGGAGSNLGNYLPQFVMSESFIALKDSGTSSIFGNSTDFWSASALGRDFSNVGFTTVIDTAAAPTSKQIVNITGSGVLTQILSPAVNNNTEIRVVIIRDGETINIDFPNAASSFRGALGGFIAKSITTSADRSTDYGSGGDSGFSSTISLLALTPLQALSSGIGLSFNQSLTITVTAVTGSFDTGLFNTNAFVSVANYIPRGFEQ